MLLRKADVYKGGSATAGSDREWHGQVRRRAKSDDDDSYWTVRPGFAIIFNAPPRRQSRARDGSF